MSPLALALVATVAPQASPPTFAVDVESVYVDVFVTDGNRPVVGLTEADFEVRDNGVRQRAELVSVESLPLAVSLVLDTSGSVAGEKLVQLHAGARALVAGTGGAGDTVERAIVAAFALYQLPEEMQHMLVLNAVGWLLAE